MMHAMDENEFDGFSFTSPMLSEIVNFPISVPTQL